MALKHMHKCTWHFGFCTMCVSVVKTTEPKNEKKKINQQLHTFSCRGESHRESVLVEAAKGMKY